MAAVFDSLCINFGRTCFRCGSFRYTSTCLLTRRDWQTMNIACECVSLPSRRPQNWRYSVSRKLLRVRTHICTYSSYYGACPISYLLANILVQLDGNHFFQESFLIPYCLVGRLYLSESARGELDMGPAII